MCTCDQTANANRCIQHLQHPRAAHIRSRFMISIVTVGATKTRSTFASSSYSRLCNNPILTVVHTLIHTHTHTHTHTRARAPSIQQPNRLPVYRLDINNSAREPIVNFYLFKGVTNIFSIVHFWTISHN